MDDEGTSEDDSGNGGRRTVADIEREMDRINDRMNDIREELDRWETGDDAAGSEADREEGTDGRIDDLVDRLDRWETSGDGDPGASTREGTDDGGSDSGGDGESTGE